MLLGNNIFNINC